MSLESEQNSDTIKNIQSKMISIIKERYAALEEMKMLPMIERRCDEERNINRAVIKLSY